MLRSIRVMLLLSSVVLIFPATSTLAQNIPSDYQEVLKTLDKKGDFKDGVLKVNVPRNDLKITIQGFPRQRHLVSEAGLHSLRVRTVPT